jgi:hypothetical protein
MSFQVKSNLELVSRVRGKIVARHQGHNVWLNVGRSWLARLVSYDSYTPLTSGEDNRISYIGFGIGGELQGIEAATDNLPLSLHYPGGHTQNDRTLSLTRLERPIRYEWALGPLPASPGLPTYDPGDVWLKEIEVPTHPLPTQLRIRMVALAAEINDALYPMMPLSEIGLFDRGQSINVHDNEPLAYDTFPSFVKTAESDITVTWTIRF